MLKIKKAAGISVAAVVLTAGLFGTVYMAGILKNTDADSKITTGTKDIAKIQPESHFNAVLLTPPNDIKQSQQGNRGAQNGKGSYELPNYKSETLTLGLLKK